MIVLIAVIEFFKTASIFFFANYTMAKLWSPKCISTATSRQCILSLLFYF